MRDEALPLLTYDPDKRRKFCYKLIEFIVNEEIKDFFSSLEGPIGIISVAGMYRTGKSYLLNRMLLNRQNGFGVGPTINPCTKVRFRLKEGNVGLGKTYIRVYS